LIVREIIVGHQQREARSMQQRSSVATADDLSKLLGALDERKAVDVLALRPTLVDVEQAAIWLAGDGDVLAKDGRPLAGVVAQIVDILGSEDEEPPRAR
jgi:hypothetical protein